MPLGIHSGVSSTEFGASLSAKGWAFEPSALATIRSAPLERSLGRRQNWAKMTRFPSGDQVAPVTAPPWGNATIRVCCLEARSYTHKSESLGHAIRPCRACAWLGLTSWQL